MDLKSTQRTMFEAVRQPLTASERMRRRSADGRSLQAVAESILKPNDRLSSFERLEIYNRQYWFRLLSALREDFPGLRALLGERRFEKLATAYLVACPSQSFTLRNLGSRLQAWLLQNLQYLSGVEEIALDMVRLEWAEVEAFDEAAKPPFTAAALAQLGDDPAFEVQPHVRLLQLRYPVDELLIEVRRKLENHDIVSNAVAESSSRALVRRRKLPPPETVYLAVHRVDNSVYFKRLDRAGFQLLQGFREGKRLSDTVASVDWSGRSDEQAAAEVQSWFAYFSAQGWLCPIDDTRDSI